jgi:Uma2 family endonuclease
MAIAPTKLWTIDDLDDLPDGRYEVWEGELIEVAAAGYEHSLICGLVVTAINNFARPARLGTATVADGGFVIARDPMTLFIPDVAFVRAGRLPDNIKPILELSPDLVVEVVSPTDRMSEVLEKVAVYLAAGVLLVWVVLPQQRIIHVYQTNEPTMVRQVHMGDELDGGGVLPGFRLPVAEIFE